MDMTIRQAEAQLTEWRAMADQRDTRVRAAIEAGVSKSRIFRLTGIARTTLDRIEASGNDPA
jgi:hypothetical protein